MGVSDYLRKNDLLFFSIQYYSITALHYLLYYCCERFHNPYVLIFIAFGLLPVLDIILPVDERNPDEAEYKSLIKQVRFKIPLYVSNITTWLIYIYSLNKILSQSNGIFFNIGLFISVSILEGASINLSHELMHKTSFISKFAGVSGLVKNFYTHFYVEHNYYHHVWVSTPQDTATSKLNQSILPFIYNSMVCSYFHGWDIENKRCLEAYGTTNSLNNFMIWSTLATLLFPLTGYYFFGVKGVLLQIAVGLLSAAFLEIINYIEHYGLRRRFIAPLGKYEPVTIHHSWNAPFRVSNYLLVKLQRHSDHHENALKPYHVLASYPDSPCLPQGYSVCLIIALIPSIWFEIMNPLVEIYTKRQKPTQEMLDKVNHIIYGYVAKVFFFTLGLMCLAINFRI